MVGQSELGTKDEGLGGWAEGRREVAVRRACDVLPLLAAPLTLLLSLKLDVRYAHAHLDRMHAGGVVMSKRYTELPDIYAHTRLDIRTAMEARPVALSRLMPPFAILHPSLISSRF